MTEKELLTELYRASGLTDFLILFMRECNSEDWGDYYIKNKVIVLYVLDEQGNMYDDETLIRVACHELAHHVQYHYLGNYDIPNKGEEHDEQFKEQFDNILNLYYNGHVPQSTLDFINKEGYGYAREKERREEHNSEQLSL